MNPKSINKKPKSKWEIIKSMKILYNDMKERFKVKEIGIFGSYAIENQKRESDIDILVEFKQGQKTFDNYTDLKYYLEEKLDLKIEEELFV